MLRVVVLLLLLVNGIYFSWSQGMLRAYGWAPAEQTEPVRLDQQIRPEAIRILNVDETRKVEIAAQTPVRPPECLQAGMFDDAQLAIVRHALETTLPAGSWVTETSVEPARWIIYMGKYSSVAAMNRRKAELGKLNLKMEPLLNPELEPGISLGGFESQAAATKVLAAVHRRGARTARVVLERAELRNTSLKIPAADDAIRARLDELKPALGDKALKSCK